MNKQTHWWNSPESEETCVDEREENHAEQHSPHRVVDWEPAAPDLGQKSLEGRQLISPELRHLEYNDVSSRWRPIRAHVSEEKMIYCLF